VGALSEQKEGSKVFNRYRQIDEDMKKELVKFLIKQSCAYLHGKQEINSLTVKVITIFA